jgi:predicted RNA-binding Zn-ribbon protein involved in translation (DUF1610 family)
MIEQDKDPQICYSCDEEFIVQTPYETEAVVEYCPFCGSEVETEEEIDFGEDDDEKEDEDDFGKF